MGDLSNNESKKDIIDENLTKVKNRSIDNKTSVRRSAHTMGSIKEPIPDKLNRSFMSGKITLQNSRPQSSIYVIDENKEIELRPKRNVDTLQSKENEAARRSDIESLKSGDLGAGGSSRFEKRSAHHNSSMNSAGKRKVSSQERQQIVTVPPVINTPPPSYSYENPGFTRSAQTSINGGSMASLPVYREQYCFYSRWSKLEKMLLLIIFVLSFVIVCLVSIVGFLAKKKDLDDCRDYPPFLDPLCNNPNVRMVTM